MRGQTLQLFLVVSVAGCSGGPVAPPDDAPEVDLDALFAPASQAEVDAVAADWAARSPGAAGVETELDTTVLAGPTTIRVRVVSHLVAGARHYGAVMLADGTPTPAPVLVFTHPDDAGVAVEDVLTQIALVGEVARRFVWVVPSFRSESLRFAGDAWRSEGEASPFDGDVDDALALLDVALGLEAAADTSAIGVLGFSRGAGVALLMGARDPRIDRIVDFFGPTDFFGPWVRGVVAEVLDGATPDLPGLAFLRARWLEPLRQGERTTAEVRLELVRRSPVLFAALLPAVQVHHGTADPVVDVSQAQSLVAAMESLGRGPPGFEAYLYPGAGHSPFTMLESLGRATTFLEALLPAPSLHARTGR